MRSSIWRCLCAFFPHKMHIRKIRLVHFRNYAKAELLPGKGVTVLYGDNAQGKTNIIEAVHLCCLGRSHRTGRDAELVRFSAPFAQVTIEVERNDGPRDVSVRIEPLEKKKKLIKINQTPAKRIGELMGHINTVLFSPEDLRLVKDGPDGRRRFLDMEISQMQPAYFYALQRYQRALLQRNELLKKLAERPHRALAETLDSWDAILAEQGGEMIARRMEYVERLAGFAGEIHASISDQSEKLTLSYAGAICDGQALLRALQSSRAEDMRRKTTSVGPHRDDIHIMLNGRDARTFASQGQQRTAVLSMKLAEIELLRAETKENPILLLDDVMSELDVGRRKMLNTRIASVQTLITCTHLSDLGGAAYDAAYRVRAGQIDVEGDDSNARGE